MRTLNFILAGPWCIARSGLPRIPEARIPSETSTVGRRKCSLQVNLIAITVEVRRAGCLNGSDVKTMEKILDEGFWTHTSMLDPETCKTASLYLPVGTWADDEEMEPVQRERLRFIGVLMRQDITEGVRTSQPFLLRVGWSNALVDRLVAGTIEGLLF